MGIFGSIFNAIKEKYKRTTSSSVYPNQERIRITPEQEKGYRKWLKREGGNSEVKISRASEKENLYVEMELNIEVWGGYTLENREKLIRKYGTPAINFIKEKYGTDKAKIISINDGRGKKENLTEKSFDLSTDWRKQYVWKTQKYLDESERRTKEIIGICGGKPTLSKDKALYSEYQRHLQRIRNLGGEEKYSRVIDSLEERLLRPLPQPPEELLGDWGLNQGVA